MAEEKLSTAQRSKIRRLSQPKELSPDEEGGELNIVPFLDIIVNVLMFVLATVSVTFTATIDTNPPKAGGAGRAPTTPTLGLSILRPDGFASSARQQRRGRVRGHGRGPAVPKANNAYDYETLGSASTSSEGVPDFADEMAVTLAVTRRSVPDHRLDDGRGAVTTARTSPDVNSERRVAGTASPDPSTPPRSNVPSVPRLWGAAHVFVRSSGAPA